MIPFGPPLVGQTEKALGALLRTVLAPHHLTETQWVTLRLTEQNAGRTGLPQLVRDRAQVPDAGEVLAELTRRGLVDGSGLTPQGCATVAAVGAQVTELTAPIWAALSAEDSATAGRVLNTVLQQTRALLEAGPTPAGTA
ncbi:MarR family transcriptional regulator [Cellulosimicrobium terreum]|nr:MarR family transcriptional regulator [Cellulosimicrobium terreum]